MESTRKDEQGKYPSLVSTMKIDRSSPKQRFGPYWRTSVCTQSVHIFNINTLKSKTKCAIDTEQKRQDSE